MVPLKKNTKIDTYQTKRGDTIIEVMFAIAVFCLVAVISIAMMNMGVAQAEGSLEVVTTRNELNAQAEALRFIHSSYIAERNLPLPPVSGSLGSGQKYRIYDELWKTITENAIKPSELGDFAKLGELVATREGSGSSAFNGCEKIYRKDTNNSSMLSRAHAFVLNTRNLNLTANSTASGGNNYQNQVDPSVSYIPSYNTDSSLTHLDTFQMSPLNARLIFYNPDALNPDVNNSVKDEFLYDNEQDHVFRAEGIWIIAVKGITDTAFTSGTNPEFYDFYIQSCWNGPTGNTPQSIDTVIRLYSPEGA